MTSALTSSPNRLAAAIRVAAHCRDADTTVKRRCWVASDHYPFGLLRDPRFGLSGLAARLRGGHAVGGRVFLPHLRPGARRSGSHSARGGVVRAKAETLAPTVAGESSGTARRTPCSSASRAGSPGGQRPTGTATSHPESERLARRSGRRRPPPAERCLQRGRRDPARSPVKGSSLIPAAPPRSRWQDAKRSAPRHQHGALNACQSSCAAPTPEPPVQLPFRRLSSSTCGSADAKCAAETALLDAEQQFPFFRVTEAMKSMPRPAPAGKSLDTVDIGREKRSPLDDAGRPRDRALPGAPAADRSDHPGPLPGRVGAAHADRIPVF